MFGQEVGTLLYRLLGIATKAQVAQSVATIDQLLVEPDGPNDARLPLNRQMRFQFYRPPQTLRIVLAATLG